MWPKEEEVEGVVEGEAEAGPGVAAVVVVEPLEVEVVAVEVVDGEATREGVVEEEGEAGEVEEEGACKLQLFGYNNPCAILFRNFVVVKINVQLNYPRQLFALLSFSDDLPEL